MSYVIENGEVWVGEYLDRPEGLAQFLAPLAGVGADIEFMLTHRVRQRDGRVLVFLAPLNTGPQRRAAQEVGMKRAIKMNTLLVEGPDRPGLLYRLARSIGQAGIRIRGVSAAARGSEVIIYISFYSPEDSSRARLIMDTVLNGARVRPKA
jgi:hypothetical protein